MHVAVIVRGVRRQHHGTPGGLDPHHLQPIGMTADAVQRHPRRDLAVAVMKSDALVEDVAHHLRDVLGRKRMAQHAVTHAAPGGVAHLAVLQMKPRVGKAIEIAGVIVVQMRDHDIPDGVGIDAEARQRVDRVERQLAIAQAGLLGVEACIDQDIAALPPDQPDEIIEVLCGSLVRIRQQVIHVRGARRHRRIAQGVDLVDVSHRLHFLLLGLADDRSKPLPIAKVKLGDFWPAPLCLSPTRGRHRVSPAAAPQRQGNLAHCEGSGKVASGFIQGLFPRPRRG